MGKCGLCERPMNSAEGCIPHKVILRSGSIIDAPSHDEIGSLSDEEPTERCHDCGAEPGGIHHRHCDWARVPPTVVEADGLDSNQILIQAVGYVPPEELPDNDVPVAGFHDERIDMAHWFPIVRGIDVPVPESAPLEVQYDDEGKPTWDTARAATLVAERFGGEAFVRSGYKSAQMHHSGSHIHGPEDVDPTLTELVSQHTMMRMPLGESLWLRERLDVDWCHYAREPLVPECRVFIRDGEVTCYHPRLEGFADHPEHRETAEEFIESAWDPLEPAEYEDREPEPGLEDYAQRVADAFDGWWSVDFVLTRDGEWYCTDMALDALAEKGDGQLTGISEHPEDCEHDVEVLAYDA